MQLCAKCRESAVDVVPEALALIRETKIKDKDDWGKGRDSIGPDGVVQNDWRMLL